ncbi:hypothetical protein Fcan01_24600 [Folsomia candida]|uniref:Uncharacterized protein n=1 Tax=Folsomia candida TaxID=158441 RepID=A0A226D719_FOLCA|nr:hypothetical protein Fcan01_24600 [Folsomia candida]
MWRRRRFSVFDLVVQRPTSPAGNPMVMRSSQISSQLDEKCRPLTRWTPRYVPLSMLKDELELFYLVEIFVYQIYQFVKEYIKNPPVFEQYVNPPEDNICLGMGSGGRNLNPNILTLFIHSTLVHYADLNK